MAERDVDKAPEARGRYRVREDTMVFAAKGKAERHEALRRIFVRSSARADAAAHARAKKLDRDDLKRRGARTRV